MDSSSDLSDPPSSDPPSSPLSELSKSPSLSPTRYPSPLSTAPSGSASPMKAHEAHEAPVADSICVNPDGGRPAKRRKVTHKERTTEYLDLRASYNPSQDNENLLRRLTTTLRKKQKIVVIAGAGISVSAGIPDFRSSKGLFKTLKTQHKLKASGKQLFDASVYKHSDSTESFHHMVREMSEQTRSAKPTAFHHMVASIAEEGRLLRLYTQNIDCIDAAMPPLATSVPLPVKGPWPKTIQLHGGLEKMVCSKCGELYPFDGSLFNGPEPPPCSGCLETDNVRTSHAGKRSHGVGKLRPRMTLYNELNPDQDAITNVIRADRKQRPDAVIVVGTSMKIPGVRALVKDLCDITRKRKDGVTAWINLDSEPSGADLKDCWDLVIRAKCDDIASLVGLPHWDESPALGQDVKVDDERFEQVKKSLQGTELEVRIPSSPIKCASSIKTESRDSTPVEAVPKSVEKVRGGIPTPTASPKMRTALPDRPQPKGKQSQLSFAGAKSGSAPKTTKKPAASRKPRQPKKTETKPKTTIKATFKATKATVVATTKNPAKRELEADQPTPTDANPVGLSGFSLRPSASRQKEERYSIGSSHDQTAVDSQLQQETNMLQGPTTPIQSSRPGSSHSLTSVSPPSNPRGLATVID